MNEDRARVFISCGQRDDGEREIARRVKEILNNLDFEAYVAVYDQTLRSIREAVFEHLLNQTEYLLFIDFRRERIEGTSEYRGSLFSHQELAIASFLELDNDILVFQEQGVMERDGMMGAFQANVSDAEGTRFSDRSVLLERIEQRVQKKWRSDWRRKLALEQADDPNCEAVPQTCGTTGYFFHIRVRNRHIRATARNCYAYLRSVKDTATGQITPFEAAELRWAGYYFPNAIIPPGECTRRFDAVWFDSSGPQYPRFNIYSDWPRCLPGLQGPGSWELEYEVISDNVPGSTIKLPLDVCADHTVCFGQLHPPVEITRLSPQQIARFNEERDRR
ncbi:MAG: hypothetical protein ACLQOO_14865 [Terriglobia bacterium]